MMQQTATLTLLAYLVLIIAGMVGWVINFITLISLVTHDAPIGTFLIARLVGVFLFPLGGVLGYF